MRSLFVLLVLTVFAFDDSLTQTLDSSEDCAECHSSAYSEWRGSMHANSSRRNNSFFRSMYDWANRTGPPGLTESCLRCHEPASSLELATVSDALVSEGVTCDICHATRLTKGSQPWFEIVPGNIKFGPIKDAVAGVHESIYSAAHSESRFCLPCHGNLSTPHGVEFCSTEQEFNKSPFAKMGVTCQDCHMPSMEGKTAPLGKLREQIHAHGFYGAYSSVMLKNCAKVDLQVVENLNGWDVQVVIQNRSVGHSLPTGSPMRMVYLVIEARDAQEKVVWKNIAGNPLEEDPRALFMRLLENESGQGPVPPWEAKRVRFDSRLGGDEVRRLQYQVPHTHINSVIATLYYRLAPVPLLNRLGLVDPKYTQPKVITSSVQILKR